ncbi:MAG TPA: SdrD B-like domain-containing protein [Candidatus Krumholzibacteriaceae bacterium]|nr:SdrD B-like domain-containing protein [Candidatus Krumholzibacteriaceae bacterium]
MTTLRKLNVQRGFTLIELVISILVTGIILIAVTGIFALFIKSSGRTSEYASAQQNSRIALDCITEHLRQAGSDLDYFRGQQPIVHAGPYQIVFNADIDNGQVKGGKTPLESIDISGTPNTVPYSGNILYDPSESYDSDAETVVFTLDSDGDGDIKSSDRGDDPEEDGENRNLFVLKMNRYGSDGASSNVVQESKIAIIRGPNLSATWKIPQPLFQYYYDHDEDPATDDLLWGDTDNSGELETSEITSISPVSQNFVDNIRRVKVTAISESDTYDKQYETNGGFLDVTMKSEVHVRNASMVSSMVRGSVFHDADGDGIQDPGETGIPQVEIQLTGQGRKVITDGYGKYFFPLSAGNYSIQEIDPPDYSSTTPNLVTVNLTAGQTKIINFGDLANDPIGVIKGTVFEDFDKNGKQEPVESGIEGVLISLDDGSKANTDGNGDYSFTAKKGSYTVVETDPTGYSSTTPNSATASIAASGDTVVVNFGDYAGPVTGTLEGTVFLDINEDGIRDVGEEGLANVTVRVSNGDSTVTNASGYYKFSLEPNTYSVTETDPVGYLSTTVNVYADIEIKVDTVVVRNFGDVLEERQDFVEVHISNTERVLSVCTTDLNEDSKNDQDIILGTALMTGIGNMLIFQNMWENTTTPVGELFHTDPDYRRDAGYNINAMDDWDINSDGVHDIITGLDRSTGNNIQFWYTESGGILGSTPASEYISSGTNEVMDSDMADFNKDGNIDILVGLKSPIGTSGAFEIFQGWGSGVFTSQQYVTTAGSSGGIYLAPIWAVAAADVDGDGDEDVIVGSHKTDYTGYIDIYLNNAYASGTFSWYARYQPFGAVNDIVSTDMHEDDLGDQDIIAGVSYGESLGRVMLWNNEAGIFGLPDTLGLSFEPETTPRLPSDYVDAGGEVLSLSIIRVNNDIYPDVTYGTRSSSSYTGNIYVLPAYGTLPVSGIQINKTEAGEIISIDTGDFNKDSRPDIVVGTRSSATQGKLVAFFGSDL